MEDRPIRPAGAGTLRAFAGLDPTTGLALADGTSDYEDMVLNQVSAPLPLPGLRLAFKARAGFSAGTVTSFTYSEDVFECVVN